jgi:hypothetical protein
VLQKLYNIFGIAETEEQKGWAGLLPGLALLTSAFPFLMNARRSAVREPLDGGEELVVIVLSGELQGRFPNPPQRPSRRTFERHVALKLTQ